MRPNESQDAVGDTVITSDGVNFQSQTDPEPRDSSPQLHFSRSSQVQSAAIANSFSLDAIGVLSQSVVTADTDTPAILASNTRFSPASEHARDELSNPVLPSFTETEATDHPGSSWSPAHKKGRTRKSTAEGNISTIEASSSNPSGSSVVKRRSSRLSGKD